MARKYDHEYKVQAVKLAKEIGGAKAAKESGIQEGTSIHGSKLSESVSWTSVKDPILQPAQ